MTLTFLNSNNNRLIIGSIIYTLISLGIIFYSHHYWDDEIFNLKHLHLSYSELISSIHNTDCHPPGSYVLNKIIYDLFSWYKAILLFSVLFNVSALVYYYKFAEKYLNDIHAKLLLFIFVFFNSGILMWTNSVRWYGYWIPLFIYSYVYILKHPNFTARNFVLAGVFLSFMTYIEYLTFIYIISLSIVFLVVRRKDLKIKNILLLLSVYISLCSYEIYFFIRDYLSAYSTEDFGHSKITFILILRWLAHIYYSVINGGGVFVADPFFFVFSLFTLLILLLGVFSITLKKIVSDVFIAQSVVLFFSFTVILICSGINPFYRYSFYLTQTS